MLDYQSLLDIQDEHLLRWRSRLKPEFWTAVRDYAKKHNREDGLKVYRGQDLVQIIYDWPNLLSCYPPAIEPVDNSDVL